MARTFPDDLPAAPASERVVFGALQTRLPDPWQVWHGVAYSAAQTGAEGEMDFVVAHPDRGLVVIEVKGGQLTCRGGRWCQDGRRLREAPAAQATREAHALVRAWESRFNAPPPFPVAHAVWFPGVKPFVPEPLDLAGITLYADDLRDPESALVRLLAAEGHAVKAPVDFAALEALLSPTVEVHRDWVLRRDLQDASIARLTEEQARAFDAFAEFRRFRVRGCAGSGKTLLALRQARVWAAQGKRVLLLCFNLLLAERLRELVRDVANIRAVAVNDLFCELLGREDDKSEDFWANLARDALVPARELGARRAFDAVIVDEGQDFSPAHWAAVQVLVPEDANFLIFYDPAQNIFARDPTAMPLFGGPDAVLTTNCRNTRGVFATLRPYAPDGVRPFPNAPAGDATEIYRADNQIALRARLRALLDRLIHREGVPEEDILLIGARAEKNMFIKDIRAAYPGLRYYTYRKFKGLEAPILILLDVREGDPQWDRSARYTAISRAVHRLFILELPPQSRMSTKKPSATETFFVG